MLAHFLLEVLGFYAGYVYYTRLGQKIKDPLSETNRWVIIIAGALGALIGSRLIAALERPDMFFNAPSLMFYYANQSIVGGLIGAIVGVEIVKKIRKEKNKSGDVFTYPLILGMMIGRVGCFLAGVKDETVGLPSHLPWALDQGDGILRHPTALYEILFLGLLWLVLRFIQKNYLLPQGALFRLFISSYLLYRFFIEFIKPIQPLAFGLSAIQISSLIIAVFYLLNLLYMYLYRPKSSATVQLP